MGDRDSSAGTSRGPRPRLRWFVAGACILSVALFIPLGWHILHSYRTCRDITESYMAGEQLRDAVCHANAELILDARSAVVGGRRVAGFTRGEASTGLRTLLGRARALRPECAGLCWLTRADSLQGELRDAEAAAIMLAGSGLTEEALDLLNGPRFVHDHEAFHASVDRYAELFKAQVERGIAAERREELRIAGVSVGILVASLVVWWVLLRVLERWRRGLMRETAERAEAERRLAASLQRFQRLFNHAHDAMYLVREDDDGIVDANLAARAQTGYTRRQLRTLRFGDLAAGDGGGGPPALAVAVGGLAEGAHRRRDGSEFPVEVGAQRFDEPGGPMLLYAVRDVTGRKALEDQLGRAQRMECVGRLAAGIAHDFGNILLAISGFAMVGRRRLPTGHPSADSLAAIELAAAQATSVARSLLNFADRPAGAVQTVELRSLVRRTLRLLEPSVPRSVDLDDSRVDGEAIWVRADPHRLQQALLNLCLNARDATSGGGRIAVSVTCRDGGAEDDEVGRIAVGDTGPGIPADVRRRLGEPFFTTRADRGGCGLGLFNVLTIIEEHGGRLEIDSAPGAGSTFTLVLPLRRVAAPAAADRQAPAVLGEAPRVLLVCAGDLVRGLAAEALRSRGFTVTALGCADDLAARLARDDGCDVVVIDGDLPDDGAAACLAQIRGATPAAAVLLVCGEQPPPAAVADGDRTLARPYTMPELCDAVAALAGQRLARLEGRS